jgi:uncharacterized protein
MSINVEKIFDTVVIGCGPSGLTVAHYLKTQNKDVIVIEKGKLLNKRNEVIPEDVAFGIGGAGLFSDGKLSYFPSATSLWSLGSKNDLNKAYQCLKQMLNRNEIKIKNWKENLSSPSSESTNRKYYESQQIPKAKRLSLIDALYKQIGKENILAENEVTAVKKDNELYEVTIKGSEKKIRAYSIVYSGGKSGALRFDQIFTQPDKVFRQYEVGVRLEFPSSKFTPYDDPQIDYKYIEKIDDKVEVRTFCCCRDGRIIESNFNGAVSFNGTSDEPKSNKSNIGVHLRVKDGPDSKILEEASRILKGECKRFTISADEFFNSDKVLLGSHIDRIIKQFILNVFDTDWSDVLIVGPTIESVGFYPNISKKRLNIENEKIWVTGDCTGFFRGLMAALLSGTFVGQQVNRYLETVRKDIVKELKIKVSSTDDMKVVFTAQSKVFFYCRDAICEYVLKKGLLPINPFRVFDYFLGDRVDRNIIRRGNNQLIKMCSELWVFGPVSDGVLFEISFARKAGIPVKYFAIATKAEEIYPLNRIEDVIFEPEVHAKQIRKEDLIRFIKGEMDFNWETDQPVYEQLSLDLGDLQ